MKNYTFIFNFVFTNICLRNLYQFEYFAEALGASRTVSYTVE